MLVVPSYECLSNGGPAPRGQWWNEELSVHPEIQVQASRRGEMIRGVDPGDELRPIKPTECDREYAVVRERLGPAETTKRYDKPRQQQESDEHTDASQDRDHGCLTPCWAAIGWLSE